MTSHRKLFFCALLCSTSLLSGCNDTASDPRTQIGTKPELPAPQQYLLPPMHVASVVGWKNGERPSVPDNLKIERDRDRASAPALALYASQWRHSRH